MADSIWVRLGDDQEFGEIVRELRIKTHRTGASAEIEEGTIIEYHLNQGESKRLRAKMFTLRAARNLRDTILTMDAVTNREFTLLKLLVKMEHIDFDGLFQEEVSD